MPKERLRCLVLVLAALLNLGSTFCYDNPGALQTDLESSLNINIIEYNIFYSVYSFPNMVLPVIGGFLVDKFGNKLSNIAFTFFIMLGQAVFALGISIRSYPIALLGRGVFGLGAEVLNISQYNVILKWFTADELSKALGVAATLNRLSSATNDVLTPIVADKISLNAAVWLGFFLCVLSFLCSLVLKRMDPKNDSKNISEEKFKVEDIKSFSFSLWLIAANCTFVYAAVYCFNNVASNYFQKRFGYSQVEGGLIMSITFIVCGVGCPIIGFLLDKYGQRIYFLILSAVFVTIAHGLFFVTPNSNQPIAPIFYMLPLGIGFSISSATVWSSLTYVVSKGSGTAYGIVLAMVDTGLVIFPVMVGVLKQYTTKDDGYYWVTFLLLSFGLCGLLSSSLLYFVNKRDTGLLFGKAEKLLEKNELLG